MPRGFTIVKEWLDTHSARDKLYFFMLGFVIIFLLFFIVFYHPLAQQKIQQLTTLQTLQKEQTDIQQQINSIQAAIKVPEFLQLNQQQMQLVQDISQVQTRLNDLHPITLSTVDFVKFKERLLNEQKKNVNLIHLQEAPATNWPTQLPKDPPPNNNPTTTENADSIFGLKQHAFQIEFQNDYSQAIAYVEQLEKISNGLYWDNLAYKVIQYPKAEVVVKFHVLTLKKN